MANTLGAWCASQLAAPLVAGLSRVSALRATQRPTPSCPLPLQCAVQPKVVLICGKAGLPVKLQQARRWGWRGGWWGPRLGVHWRVHTAVQACRGVFAHVRTSLH